MTTRKRATYPEETKEAGFILYSKGETLPDISTALSVPLETVKTWHRGTGNRKPWKDRLNEIKRDIQALSIDSIVKYGTEVLTDFNSETTTALRWQYAILNNRNPQDGKPQDSTQTEKAQAAAIIKKIIESAKILYGGNPEGDKEKPRGLSAKMVTPETIEPD